MSPSANASYLTMGGPGIGAALDAINTLDVGIVVISPQHKVKQSMFLNLEYLRNLGAFIGSRSLVIFNPYYKIS